MSQPNTEDMMDKFAAFLWICVSDWQKLREFMEFANLERDLPEDELQLVTMVNAAIEEYHERSKDNADNATLSTGQKD